MQIAAADPMVITADELPQKAIDEERETYRKQALNEGKPEAVVDKIVEGRIKKYQQEVCLLLQPFIKDQDQTVGDMLTATASKVGENIGVRRFVRYRLGDDGIA
jgi:elongation factor Ts